MKIPFHPGAFLVGLGIVAGAALLPNLSVAESPGSKTPVMAFCSQEEDAIALKELWTQQLQDEPASTKTLQEATNKSCVSLKEADERALADTVRLYLLAYGPFSRGSVVMAFRTERGRGDQVTVRGWLVAIASTFSLEDLDVLPTKPADTGA